MLPYKTMQIIEISIITDSSVDSPRLEHKCSDLRMHVFYEVLYLGMIYL